MEAYEAGRPSYFATPPVNLVYAFHASLKQIVEGTPSLEDRLRLHRETSQRIKDAIRDLGLTQLPVDDSVAANGMTAVKFYFISRLVRLNALYRFIYQRACQLGSYCHVSLARAL